MSDTNGRARPSLAGPGRPTKRTPEVEQILLDALGLGLSYESSAKLARIAHSTFEEWMRNDSDFRAICEEARMVPARTCAHYLMEQAREGSSAAAIFFLKCRAPEFREPKDEIVAETRAIGERIIDGIERARQRRDAEQVTANRVN